MRNVSQVVGHAIETGDDVRRGEQSILQLRHRHPQRRAGPARLEPDADQIDITGRQGDHRPRHLSGNQVARLPLAGLGVDESIAEVEDDSTHPSGTIGSGASKSCRVPRAHQIALTESASSAGGS